MSGWHFERMAADYATARPAYPAAVFELLTSEGVIGPDFEVLEVGAGAGLATRDLVAAGSKVVALEPGAALACLLAQTVPGVRILRTRLEDADLPPAAFDSVVAATSMHWVDLSVGLPKLHASLRTGGRLAVFRTVFGDDATTTDFRRRVSQIVARRGPTDDERGEARPTTDELCAGGLFEPVRSERWRWSLDLTADEVTRLFATFSNWTEAEVEQVASAADACGGVVTEHYQSVLHLLARA